MDGPSATGKHIAFHVDDRTGLWTPTQRVATRNLLLYTWGYIASRCIGVGDPQYRISVAYLEFENTPPPISVPSYDRTDGLQYYMDLSSVSGRDYLRVPIRPQPDVVVAPGYEEFLTPDQGNCCIFYAQSVNGTGVWGRPFTSDVNSTVIGIALAATPVPNDPSQDIVFARSYYAPENQVPKVPSGQIGIQYPMTFE